MTNKEICLLHKRVKKILSNMKKLEALGSSMMQSFFQGPDFPTVNVHSQGHKKGIIGGCGTMYWGHGSNLWLRFFIFLVFEYMVS